MNNINIPLKNEFRSRARMITDEAFRETRNYLNLDREILNRNINNQKNYNLINSNSADFYNKNEEKNITITKEIENDLYNINEIQEILNKLTIKNFSFYSNIILKKIYNNNSMEDLKVKLFKYLYFVYFII